MRKTTTFAREELIATVFMLGGRRIIPKATGREVYRLKSTNGRHIILKIYSIDADMIEVSVGYITHARHRRRSSHAAKRLLIKLMTEENQHGSTERAGGPQGPGEENHSTC